MPKNIPVLHVCENSLAQAYEEALLMLYEKGVRMKTQYDKNDEPPSIDATMNITILEPWSDPMIHKAFPGGLSDLREYVYELEGLKDSWTKNMNIKEDTRWEYVYSGRLRNYGTTKMAVEQNDGNIVSMIVGEGIDQIKYVIDSLVKCPYTRRAQMITWMPSVDHHVYDAPCLQSLHYRLLEENDVYYLNCNVRFRSNDAWEANFMNMFGFIQFNKNCIASEIEKRIGKKVELGRLNWQADSYHIYGKKINEFETRIWNRLMSTKFEDRVFNFHDPMIQEMYKEDEQMILDKINSKTMEMKEMDIKKWTTL
jgi:thymidylate synthase